MNRTRPKQIVIRVSEEELAQIKEIIGKDETCCRAEKEVGSCLFRCN